jgi:hypothetical protein
MNSILVEATYGLSDHNISKKNLLDAVLGNRLASLFIENKEAIKKLNSTEEIINWLETQPAGATMRCGFSIRSNLGGGTEKKDLFGHAEAGISSVESESGIKDVVYHHVYRTHAIKHVMPLTTVQHTALHNYIRQLFEKAFDEQSKTIIDKAYEDYVAAKPKQVQTYTDFGDRLKYYEVALIKIAKVALNLLTIEKFTEFHAQAITDLKKKGIIPETIKVLRADKVSKNELAQNTKSVSEEFKLYESLWD